jgi:hypothetical protein
VMLEAASRMLRKLAGAAATSASSGGNIG